MIDCMCVSKTDHPPHLLYGYECVAEKCVVTRHVYTCFQCAKKYLAQFLRTVFRRVRKIAKSDY